ncbi:MAG: VOC family protein [Tepidisphaeraceae bacterium]
MASGVIPHLTVDNASAAIEFYKKGLGAKELARHPAEDGKRLMHATIEVNGATVFLNDDFPDMCGGKSKTPKAIGGTPITLHLDVPNCDAAVKRAVDAGAKCTLEPFDAFWGMRYAQIVDPYGHEWAIAHALPQK